MFDVCVVGHLTFDIIKIDGVVEQKLPGGTAYYTSIALNTLGLKVAVLTKTSAKDRDYLLSNLTEKGITVFWKESPKTSIFEDIYERDKIDWRQEKVWVIASPFYPEDLEEIQARVFHLVPLTNQDLAPDLCKAVAKKSNFISLDIQGLIRQINPSGTVTELDWYLKESELKYIKIIKADDKEVKILSGKNDINLATLSLSNYGIREVIITFGSRGSLIYAEDKITNIPAYPPQKIVDATGCGDTYMAGYIYQRLKDNNLKVAGKFGALVASKKLENFGALKQFSLTN